MFARAKEIAHEIRRCLSQDVKEFFGKMAEDDFAYREPDEAQASRQCIYPPPTPELRATQVPYLRVVVNRR
jgi:hypothetical protein